jgi:hypothetical protein
MATRKQLWHPDEVRQKIQASQLINRLTAHANSEKPLMDSSQVMAAKILLGKAIPDLSSVQLDGNVRGNMTFNVNYRRERRPDDQHD